MNALLTVAELQPTNTESTGAAASLVPQSVPTFKSFAHITDPRVRRAKEYEQYLLFALDHFPEFSPRIQIELQFARSEQKRSKANDADVVLKSLEFEELTASEVSEDTRLPYSTVYKILRELLDQGIIKAKSRPGLSANKPIILYSHAKS